MKSISKPAILIATLIAATQAKSQWSGTPIEIQKDRAEIGYPGYPVGSGFLTQLDIHTDDPSQWAGGAAIIQHNSTGSAALHLTPLNKPGSYWALYALGVSNHVSSPSNDGDFTIFDGTGGQFGTGESGLLIKKNSGRVGIGTVNPNAKLHVESGYSTGYAGWFKANGFYHSAGFAEGVVGQAYYFSPSTGIANVGVDGSAGTGSGSGNDGNNRDYGYCIGVWGTAYASRTSIGGRFDAVSSAVQNIGVYSTAAGWAGYFVGNVYRSGTDNFTSDRKLKQDIKPLSNSLDKLMKLKPSTYTFKTEEYNMMHLPEGKQMGLIAQELEEVLPELVTNMPELTMKNRDGSETVTPEFKSVQYIQLIPLMIGGLQEQQHTIDKLINNAEEQKQLIAALKSIVEEQKQAIAELQKKTLAPTGVRDTDVEIGFQMSQNEPNPFTHETVVNYTLSETVQNAFMAVYDLAGKQITTFPIEHKGSSSLTLTSEKLTAGIYIYSIVADGKVMDSKRMIITEK
jgi:hypothetical protein